MSSGTVMVYNRAMDRFEISSKWGSKHVTEQTIRAVGDMDITHAMERAKYNPYEPIAIGRRA